MDITPAADISSMNGTAQGLVMTICAMSTETGQELHERISDELTAEMMFNKGTAPFPSL